jgi:phosphate starvation-inducible protein PhoH
LLENAALNALEKHDGHLFWRGNGFLFYFRDCISLAGHHLAAAICTLRQLRQRKAKNAPTWKKMYHYFKFRNEEFLEHYNKWSSAEKTFYMTKSKFGDSVRSKTPQVNEVLLKVLRHDICVGIQERFELGIEPDFFSA